MPAKLSLTQRAILLRFVLRHSPDGRPFSLDRLQETLPDVPGTVLGNGLLALAAEGLCGVEDPDLVWSTPEGITAAGTEGA